MKYPYFQDRKHFSNYVYKYKLNFAEKTNQNILIVQMDE